MINCIIYKRNSNLDLQIKTKILPISFDFKKSFVISKIILLTFS